MVNFRKSGYSGGRTSGGTGGYYSGGGGGGGQSSVPAPSPEPAYTVEKGQLGGYYASGTGESSAYPQDQKGGGASPAAPSSNVVARQTPRGTQYTSPVRTGAPQGSNAQVQGSGLGGTDFGRSPASESLRAALAQQVSPEIMRRASGQPTQQGEGTRGVLAKQLVEQQVLRERLRNPQMQGMTPEQKLAYVKSSTSVQERSRAAQNILYPTYPITTQKSGTPIYDMSPQLQEFDKLKSQPMYKSPEQIQRYNAKNNIPRGERNFFDQFIVSKAFPFYKGIGSFTEDPLNFVGNKMFAFNKGFELISKRVGTSLYKIPRGIYSSVKERPLETVGITGGLVAISFYNPVLAAGLAGAFFVEQYKGLRESGQPVLESVVETGGTGLLTFGVVKGGLKVYSGVKNAVTTPRYFETTAFETGLENVGTRNIDGKLAVSGESSFGIKITGRSVLQKISKDKLGGKPQEAIISLKTKTPAQFAEDIFTTGLKGEGEGKIVVKYPKTKPLIKPFKFEMQDFIQQTKKQNVYDLQRRIVVQEGKTTSQYGQIGLVNVAESGDVTGLLYSQKISAGKLIADAKLLPESARLRITQPEILKGFRTFGKGQEIGRVSKKITEGSILRPITKQVETTKSLILFSEEVPIVEFGIRERFVSQRKPVTFVDEFISARQPTPLYASIPKSLVRYGIKASDVIDLSRVPQSSIRRTPKVSTAKVSFPETRYYYDLKSFVPETVSQFGTRGFSTSKQFFEMYYTRVPARLRGKARIGQKISRTSVMQPFSNVLKSQPSSMRTVSKSGLSSGDSSLTFLQESDFSNLQAKKFVQGRAYDVSFGLEDLASSVLKEQYLASRGFRSRQGFAPFGLSRSREEQKKGLVPAEKEGFLLKQAGFSMVKQEAGLNLKNFATNRLSAGLRESLMLKSLSSQRLENVQRIEPVQRVMNIQRINQVQNQMQLQRMDFRVPPQTVQKFGFRIPNVPLVPPVPPPWIPLSRGGGDDSKRVRVFGGVKRYGRYVGSILAVLKGIKTTRKPRAVFGFEIQPVLVKGRRKIKKGGKKK